MTKRELVQMFGFMVVILSGCTSDPVTPQIQTQTIYETKVETIPDTLLVRAYDGSYWVLDHDTLWPVQSGLVALYRGEYYYACVGDSCRLFEQLTSYRKW